MTWTLIIDEEIPQTWPPYGHDSPPPNPHRQFTWLRVWEAIVGDGQTLRRSEYSRPN